MQNLIIGIGEVGTALGNIFTDADLQAHHYNSYDCEILHIAFPYSNEFENEVKRYQKLHNPKHTIIHSTVPVGTSRKLNAIHSPIRGIHPNLEQGIRTFVKFIGGEQASEVADLFRKSGIRVMLFDRQETTEALKLFDTEYFRTCVEFTHRVKRYCNKHNLNFAEVYTLPNITYNEGYGTLGYKEYYRPVLEPIMKEIGGHCLVPNSKLIKLSE